MSQGGLNIPDPPNNPGDKAKGQDEVKHGFDELPMNYGEYNLQMIHIQT